MNKKKKKEIENKILAINLENDIEKVLDEVFRTELAEDILENYNGFDPLDTVVRVVGEILKEVKE